MVVADVVATVDVGEIRVDTLVEGIGVGLAVVVIQEKK